MRFRYCLANFLVFFLSLGLLAHLLLIIVYGQVLIRESDSRILIAEVAAMVGIIAFAVSNLVVIHRLSTGGEE